MKSLNESSVRSRAKVRGLQLQKSRSRNKNWPGYGTYRVIDPSTNTVVHGGNHDTFGASLSDCAQYIDKRAKPQTAGKTSKSKTTAQKRNLDRLTKEFELGFGISRETLEHCGYNTDRVSDSTMKEMADEIADSMDGAYSLCFSETVEQFNIPKRRNN
jgi:hypothetical protein